MAIFKVVQFVLQHGVKSTCIALVLCVLANLPLHEVSAQSLVFPNELRSIKISVNLKGKNSSRDIFCLARVPGLAKKRGSNFAFTPFKATIRTLKRSDPTSPKLPLFRALSTAGTVACASPAEPSPPNATPTPSGGSQPSAPTATPTPNIQPTATPVPGNFDAKGNVTEKGKIYFGIPAHLSGNVTTGKQVYTSFCTGCHTERVGRSYPELDVAIRKSPMLYDEGSISRQELADLVAYLNRFRA